MPQKPDRWIEGKTPKIKVASRTFEIRKLKKGLGLGLSEERPIGAREVEGGRPGPGLDNVPTALISDLLPRLGNRTRNPVVAAIP